MTEYKKQLADAHFDQIDLSLLTDSQLEFLRDEAARLLAERQKAGKKEKNHAY